MQRFLDFRDIPGQAVTRGSVVSIGNFDGVHLGHQSIVSHALQEASVLGMTMAVLTFEPHPSEVLAPKQKRMRLASPARKVALLGELGVELLLSQHVDLELLSLSADDFCFHVLAQSLSARAVVVGENFRFGRGRRGDIASLTRCGQELGFEVHVSALVQISGEAVSSTRVRQQLLAGEVKVARELLGRPHELSGVVVRGHGKGRSLGFPTINLAPVETLLPHSGIYAALCRLSGEPSLLPAAVYIGNRPTLGHGETVEAHLIGASGDLYGRSASLLFIERVRAEQRFTSEAELRTQMAKDIGTTERILEEYHG